MEYILNELFESTPISILQLFFLDLHITQRVCFNCTLKLSVQE